MQSVRSPTFEAVKAGFKVRRQIARTRLVAMHGRDREATRVQVTRAETVDNRKYVSNAPSHVTVVPFDTPSHAHAPVERTNHDDNLRLGALGVERLQLAVVT